MILLQVERHDSKLHRPFSRQPLTAIPSSRTSPRQVPELEIQLPSNAVGEDFLPGSGLFAAAPSGSRFQASLYGLIGILRAVREGLEADLLDLSFWSRPGQAGIQAAGPRPARDGRPIEWQPPLTSIAEPGSAARSPSRWRATRRHASRCIRARRREPRSDAVGRSRTGEPRSP